ncbi:hypothetical protein D3C80_1582420 [compost metagenome]
MSLIVLKTQINADPETCFYLSRSVDLHLISTESTGEMAIAGRIEGLIELNESVTWKSKH